MRKTVQRFNLAFHQVDTAYWSSESDAALCVLCALDMGQALSQKEICRDWMLPKTTVNTIAKRFERLGYVTFTPRPGSRREMRLSLTEIGRAYVQKRLARIYRAEEAAMEQTLSQFGDGFIAALELYGQSLKAAFEKQKKEDP